MTAYAVWYTRNGVVYLWAIRRSEESARIAVEAALEYGAGEKVWWTEEKAH